jgi:hypothetical protein
MRNSGWFFNDSGGFDNHDSFLIVRWHSVTTGATMAVPPDLMGSRTACVIVGGGLLFV